MRSKKPEFLSNYCAQTRRYLVALLAFALSLSFAFAPGMVMAKSMHYQATHDHIILMDDDRSMAVVAEPCCEDCDTEQSKSQPCDNSLSCMSACSAVPMQISNAYYEPARQPVRRLALSFDESNNGITSSPNKRPPKSIQ